jgi:hypothetical protein
LNQWSAEASSWRRLLARNRPPALPDHSTDSGPVSDIDMLSLNRRTIALKKAKGGFSTAPG